MQRYLNCLKCRYYWKTLLFSATIPFSTIQITVAIHTININKQLELPVLFTLPQNNFNILIKIVTWNLLLESNL